MLEVEAAKSCIDGRGRYEVWAHYVVPGEGLRFAKFALAGTSWDIERGVGKPPSLLGPGAVLDMLRAYCLDKVVGKLIPRSLATASLIRICDRTTHADSNIKQLPGGGKSISEAAIRGIWLSPETSLPLVGIGSVALNHNGVARLPIRGSSDGMSCPIVSVPLTPAEVSQSLSIGKIAVPVGPSSRLQDSVYALIHPGRDGLLAEQVVPPRVQTGAAG